MKYERAETVHRRRCENNGELELEDSLELHSAWTFMFCRCWDFCLQQLQYAAYDVFLTV